MSDDEELRPKRRKKPPKHECTVILLDVGSNMGERIPGSSTLAIDCAKEVVDWILTRKIFSESPDEFVLVLFGSDETKNPYSSNKNIFFCEEEMQTARIDWLKLIEKEVKPSKKIKGDFLTALIDAVNFLRSSLESAEEGTIIGSNILLVSNLAGHRLGEAEEDFKDANAVVNGINTLHTNFNVIGPYIQYWEGKEESVLSDESYTKGNVKLEVNESLLNDIVKRCKGLTYSFNEALSMLQHFIPRRVSTRGQRFLLEIADGVKLPLCLYKKVQPADMNLKFKKFDISNNNEVKRETVYEKVRRSDDDSKIEEFNDKEEEITNRDILKKEDVVKGYTFGATIIPFNDADKQEYGWKREPRSMRLMQFAKRSEILEHYLMDGSAYYCIPPADDEDGCIAVSALVRALIEEECVAITRFVYNAASYPRLLALFPKISKKGVDMFVAIQLPYYEDFRGLEFPSLEDSTSQVRADQSRAIEALVSAMDLSTSHFDCETGEYGEGLRPKHLLNPKIQRLCEVVKFRALHPKEQLPQMESRIIDELLVPQPQLLKAANEPLLWIEKSFTLQEIKKPRKTSGGFDDLNDNSLPGFGEDNSTLPESGRFITVEETKKEGL